MSLRILECAQRTPEWFAARAGRVTGSRAADVMAKIKTGEAAARRDYRLQLAVERITGKPLAEDIYVTADMQRGIDLEPMARAKFAELHNLEVRETGFVIRDDLLVGCSTDGDIDAFGSVLEIKCPKTATHVGYLRDRKLPSKYLWQVTHNVYVTQAQGAWFMSYDDRLPDNLQTFSVFVSRAELPLADYVFELKNFLAEVEREHQELLKL